MGDVMRYAADLVVGSARWTLVPHDGGHEFEDLVAAIELDRVWPSDLARLGHALRRGGRARRGWGREWWAALMHGARGLRRSDAKARVPYWTLLGRTGLVWDGFRIGGDRAAE